MHLAVGLYMQLRHDADLNIKVLTHKVSTTFPYHARKPSMMPPLKLPTISSLTYLWTFSVLSSDYAATDQ